MKRPRAGDVATERSGTPSDRAPTSAGSPPSAAGWPSEPAPAPARPRTDALRAAQRAYDEHMTRGPMPPPPSPTLGRSAARRKRPRAGSAPRTPPRRRPRTRRPRPATGSTRSTTSTTRPARRRPRRSASARGGHQDRHHLEHLVARGRRRADRGRDRRGGLPDGPPGAGDCDERVDADQVQPAPAVAACPVGRASRRGRRGGRAAGSRAEHWGNADDVPAAARRPRGDDGAGRSPGRRRRRGRASLADWISSQLVDAIVAVAHRGRLAGVPGRPLVLGHVHPRSRTARSPRRWRRSGYRFDGLGGFVDERVPTQRDLSIGPRLCRPGPDAHPSLADGRRRWPPSMRRSPWLPTSTSAATAGDLSLGELIALLGRRADALAELWNEWGHVRPLLLEGA